MPIAWKKFFGIFVERMINPAGAIEIGSPIDVLGTVTLDAEEVSDVKHLLKDGDGKTLLATGTTVPADTATLYAKGCLFIDTDVVTGTSGLYVNVGTAASCVFKLVTNAS